MFKKLKDAIDAALSALEGKAGESPREDIERLLDGMRKELIDHKARVPVLPDDTVDTDGDGAAELADADRVGVAEGLSGDLRPVEPLPPVEHSPSLRPVPFPETTGPCSLVAA